VVKTVLLDNSNNEQRQAPEQCYTAHS